MPARGPLVIAAPDRPVLRGWAAAPGRRAQRAAIVLLAGQGVANGEIARRLGVSRPAVITWRARYAEGGLDGLADRPRSGRPPQARVAAIVACTLRVAPRSRSATSCARWVAAELGVSVVTVGRAWRTARVNIAASGAVVLEADPPLPVTGCELAGLCVHGRSAIALLRPLTARSPSAPARVRPGGVTGADAGVPGCSSAEVAAMRRLLAASGCGGGLHGVVAGNALGGWARLGAGTSRLAWHVAPSDEAWLAVVEAVMCAGAQPPERVIRAARQITSEIGRRLAAPGGPGGWLAWTADGACVRAGRQETYDVSRDF
jgi:transposase